MLKRQYFVYFLILGFLILSGCSVLNNYMNKGKQEKMLDDNKVIFTFLSAPGAGKGTLANRCAQSLGFLVLSTGDLFRQHIANNTSIGLELKKYMDAGQLVPDELVMKMAKEWLISRKDLDKPIILDGFPRTSVQAQKLLGIIQKDLPSHNFRVVKLEIPQEEITQRLVNRRVCPNKSCQGVYNTSMPEIASGKCPKCQTELIIRKDDDPKVIADRFQVYDKHEKELINAYESEGLKIEILNVSKKTPDQIFEEFKEIL
jgi:adenylate kinase